MSTPTFSLIFDRRKRATSTKEGAIELRITYNRIQRHITTGVRCLPKQWRGGTIVNRLDAYELQKSLDMFVAGARKTVNDLMARGELDMDTLADAVTGRQKRRAEENVASKALLLDFCKERAAVRKYGRTPDSQKRYDRFLKWLEEWGGMVTFDDVTELNIIAMDKALNKKNLKACSKWNNYHRFLNSFILDAIDAGIMRKNPYHGIHIDKDKQSDGLHKFLTKEEFDRLAALKLPTTYLQHARDLFVFQTYTCLAYVDLAAFDAHLIREVGGRPTYVGKRGKTRQEYTFMLLQPALDILERYDGHLPIMSNQKYNDQLKVLAVMAKIDKPLSSHWARHTGATLLLNLGLGMEIVARVLGHASTKMTREVYAKLLDDTVVSEMEKVEEKL